GWFGGGSLLTGFDLSGCDSLRSRTAPTDNHWRIGTVKPVLGREKTSSGKGQSGAWSIILLFGGCPFPIHFPVERSNSISTSGTRISSEGGVRAQSDSRSSG